MQRGQGRRSVENGVGGVADPVDVADPRHPNTVMAWSQSAEGPSRRSAEPRLLVVHIPLLAGAAIVRPTTGTEACVTVVEDLDGDGACDREGEGAGRRAGRAKADGPAKGPERGCVQPHGERSGRAGAQRPSSEIR